MKSKNKLLNKVVLVHPQLTTDPLERQGHVGKIIDPVPTESVCYVHFEDGVTGAYQPEGLLTLSSSKTISFNQLLHTGEEAATIKKVMDLADQGKYEEALKLASSNAIVQESCTIDFLSRMQRVSAKKAAIKSQKH